MQWWIHATYLLLQSLKYIKLWSNANLNKSRALIELLKSTSDTGWMERWRQMCSLSCTPAHSCHSAIRRQAEREPLPFSAAPDEIKGMNRQRNWESRSTNPPTQSAATTKAFWQGLKAEQYNHILIWAKLTGSTSALSALLKGTLRVEDTGAGSALIFTSHVSCWTGVLLATCLDHC